MEVQRTAINERPSWVRWAWLTFWMVVAVGLAVVFAVTHVAGYAWVMPPLLLFVAWVVRLPGGSGPTTPVPAPREELGGGPAAAAPAVEPA